MTDPETNAAPATPTSHRKARNLVLDPSLQLRLGAYLVAIATTLSLAFGWQVWRASAEASKVAALGDPRSDEVVAAMLAGEDRSRMLWMGAIVAGVSLCLLFLAVATTHRIAGPAWELARVCRSVAAGSLGRPRSLRRGDFLVGLASEVRTMVESLRAQEETEKIWLEEAARAIATSPDQARRMLEELAAEKGRRLES
ncbi:MAG TPA: hypothetical protein VMK12_25140 [Anaeromyxobacteraceae bacterium]|nr:hypothetical protein [Anaeromyxobacteraceae bacterium]